MELSGPEVPSASTPSAGGARSAREGSAGSSVTQGDQTADPAEPDDDADALERGPGLWERLKVTVLRWFAVPTESDPRVGLFRPPEVWTHRSPSLRDVWYYARYGQWTGASTFGRKLGCLYGAVVALPARFVGAYVLWIIDRPARLFLAWLAWHLFCLTPPGQITERVLGALALWLLT